MEAVLASSAPCYLKTLAARLNALIPLSTEEAAAVNVLRGRIRQLSPGEVVVSENERPEQSSVLVSGFLARHRSASDGRRQIVSLCVPGELCDIQCLQLNAMDHTISAVTSAIVMSFSHHHLRGLAARYPDMMARLWRETLLNAALHRRWVFMLGRCDAFERMAHFLCEMEFRLAAVGLSDGRRFELPLTQAQLADALGITPVHVNRVLQEMRSRRLITYRMNVVEILHKKALTDACDFTPAYLVAQPAFTGRSVAPSGF